MNDYTCYQYTDEQGSLVVSAIHWRDGAKFRADYPDAIAIRQFRVGGLCHTDNINKIRTNKMEIENEIDINENDDININALTPKQKALRLNALVRLAQGDTFTTHDLEEALSLTRQMMKRQGN